MKKLINDPRDVVTEMIEGLVAAYGGRVRRLESVNAIVRTEIPQGKVGLLVGGGSGHEPIFHGFVGEQHGRRRRHAATSSRRRRPRSCWRRPGPCTAGRASSTSTATTPATT